ncbi:hypothetical protein, partial [Ruegeria sp. HKCCE3926]|uniref:hypothetical protein n=1 Tax=Ruegeria sp. HKCCE3926 TaxID=2794831 RepID=UPI001AE1336B
ATKTKLDLTGGNKVCDRTHARVNNLAIPKKPFPKNYRVAIPIPALRAKTDYFDRYFRHAIKFQLNLISVAYQM